ncbi:MAG: V-type ATP synthase subunit F [Candidatus Coatesbacteria bacterium]|nr:V-type ATP synthase subunit F [Candidatus Coatesbacteria bacterium]
MDRPLESIYFIGREDQLRGFRVLGVSVVGVESLSQAEHALRKAVRDDAVAVFITEDFGALMQETLELFGDRPLPVITLIPTAEGASGGTRRRIRRLVERAVGADILGDD